MDKSEEFKFGGTGDAAVRSKTGRGWLEWFDLLDEAGAREMSHKEIVAFLKDQYEVSPWWQQHLTGTYEQARAGREKHQMPDGFQIGKSKTIAVPVSALYTAWVDESQRVSWLQDPGFSIRKANPEKSLRITWVDGRTSLDVYFNPKGETQSQVTINHKKLVNSGEAEQMKAYWGATLDRLKDHLESRPDRY